jgi:integrase
MATNKQLGLPRGIRVFSEPAGSRQHRHAVQWRENGRRRTRFFEQVCDRDEFAKGLKRDRVRSGVAVVNAFANGAAEKWRSFVEKVGPNADLEMVAACWKRYGAGMCDSPLTPAAVKAYLAHKEAEKLDPATLSHYRSLLENQFAAAAPFAAARVGDITRERICDWLASLACADTTKQTMLNRVSGLFEWLRVSGQVPANPCELVPRPRMLLGEVETITPAECLKLFQENADQDQELLGRLALEAFAGLRFSSAAKIHPSEIVFSERGLRLPAAKLKTRRAQFIDGLPDNLWEWLHWSNPLAWTMTPRQYLEAKSNAFIRAKVRHPRNALRHTFCTYHMAMHRDASKTAVLLCHSSPKTLWAHYKGKGSSDSAAEYFAITPECLSRDDASICNYAPDAACIAV